jgi:DNA-binding PadR family transcriptional regulator
MPLGEFELLVMLAVMRLKDDAHAAQVRDEIETRSGRAAPRGSVYITLDRLIRKGYVRERSVAGGPERGGRPKRLFAPTAAGRHATEHALAGLRRMQRGLAWHRTD